MADVRPFAGIRYDKSVTGDLSRNLCPPFDVMTADQQLEFYERSHHNVVRLEFGIEYKSDRVDDNRYTRARSTFNQWVADGALVKDSIPAFYATRERFNFHGQEYVRIGLTCAVRVENFKRGDVMPHEETRPAPKKDRLELVRHTRANFSPLMVLYRDNGTIRTAINDILVSPPDAVASPANMPDLELWIVSEPEIVSLIAVTLRDAQLYLADGHHRYETAVTYRDEMLAKSERSGSAATGFRMMTLIEITDPGLLLLGYHRVLAGASSLEEESLRDKLGSMFELQTLDIGSSSDQIRARRINDVLSMSKKDRMVMGIAGLSPQTIHIATAHEPYPKDNGLAASDYTVLQNEILLPNFGETRVPEVLNFEHDAAQALAEVREGRAQVAFIMRAMSLSSFEHIVSSGWRLPAKSTYFHPKLHTGTVIQDLDDNL